jgi:hypothetical protein
VSAPAAKESTRISPTARARRQSQLATHAFKHQRECDAKQRCDRDQSHTFDGVDYRVDVCDGHEEG